MSIKVGTPTLESPALHMFRSFFGRTATSNYGRFANGAESPIQIHGSTMYEVPLASIMPPHNGRGTVPYFVRLLK